MALEQAVSNQLTFIPFLEGMSADAFAEWMNENGRTDYVDVEGGIVVLLTDRDKFVKCMQEAEQFCKD